MTRLIALLSYYLGITRLFYFLNRRAKRIVTFHNVMPERLLPQGKTIGLTDTEETFAMKIREIQRFFTISNDLNDARSATITFDDGYRNEIEIAQPLMKNLPGIIFTAGHEINNSQPENSLTIDLLLHWTHLVPNGKYLDFDVTDDREILWQQVIWPRFVQDAENKGEKLLKTLDEAYPMKDILAQCSEEYLHLRLTGFSTDEIENIRKQGWLVGWHTQNHYPLSRLSTDDKQFEIDTAAPDDMKNVVLSYPYGENASVDAECLKIAENAGYPCAVSNLINTGSMHGKFFLPRITLSNDKYLLHFELSGVKHFLKTRKLLS